MIPLIILLSMLFICLLLLFIDYLVKESKMRKYRNRIYKRRYKKLKDERERNNMRNMHSMRNLSRRRYK